MISGPGAVCDGLLERSKEGPSPRLHYEFLGASQWAAVGTQGSGLELPRMFV